VLFAVVLLTQMVLEREPGRKRCIVAGHHSASACRRSSEPARS